MKKIRLLIYSVILSFGLLTQCTGKIGDRNNDSKILFLHHSTGGVIFEGGINPESGEKINIPNWMDGYNKKEKTNYTIKEQAFPKDEPYGWSNYPYDYYNIWVKHAGDIPYTEEPTLEILTKQFNLIIFKHCFPVSDIIEDNGIANVDSDIKTISNYKLQYQALKLKMYQFPETKFLVWTGAALSESNTTKENAERARSFFDWVKNEWDEKDDNIYLWDFRQLETEGGLFLTDAFLATAGDSHPSSEFAGKVVPLFGQRLVDVIENNGTTTTLTGELKNE